MFEIQQQRGEFGVSRRRYATYREAIQRAREAERATVRLVRQYGGPSEFESDPVHISEIGPDGRKRLVEIVHTP